MDTSEPWQLYYQDAASPIMEECVHFHDYLMFFLILIFFFITTLLLRVIFSFNLKSFSHRYLIHGVLLEIIWTLIPAIILLFIAIPSFSLLYLIDEVINTTLTFKAIGHQWYWSYEFSSDKTFDSYMIPTSDLTLGQLRLLEVDNSLLLPINTHIRLIATAADVIHSWAVPSLGIKLDCIPGTLNQTSFIINRPGIYFGQCSEICGFGHSYMPIVVKGVSINTFLNWLQSL